jgi:hypothetical protein
MAIEAREYEANNSTQLPTIATPAEHGQQERGAGPECPAQEAECAQISSKGAGAEHAAPDTTSSTGCPETSTNQPMVPKSAWRRSFPMSHAD